MSHLKQTPEASQKHYPAAATSNYQCSPASVRQLPLLQERVGVRSWESLPPLRGGQGEYIPPPSSPAQSASTLWKATISCPQKYSKSIKFNQKSISLPPFKGGAAKRREIPTSSRMHNFYRAVIGFVLFHQDLPTTLRPKIRASVDERSIYSGRHHVGNPTIKFTFKTPQFTCDILSYTANRHLCKLK